MQTVATLDAAKAEEVKRNEFKAKLKKAIDDATPQPKTESQAEDVMKNGAEKASGTLRSALDTERDAAAGSMKSAVATEVPASSQPAPPTATLQSEPVGPPPAPVSAAPVVPAPLPPERLDYSADRAPTDQVMAENNVTKEQIQEANDPAFGPALQARSSAEKHEAAAEAKYRQGESKVQDHAHTAATLALTKNLAGMHGVREQQIGKVVSQQLGTKGKDAQERQRITDTITAIKDKTRTDVEAILKSMEDEAVNIFDAGLKRAENAYEDTFEEAKGGVGTWLTTWGSDWEELIENSLGKARAEYLRQVGLAIDEVANFIDGKLEAAKQCVADGLKKVEKFVDGLGASVKHFGEEAMQAVSADFDTMGRDIDQRRDGLINKLTEQYKASYERMSAMEEKLREENKSLWQRVYDATVGLIKKIIEFKNMLLSALGRAAAVILDIIAHPIRFLGNLVSGVSQGLNSFMSKIDTYLLKGLMDWLFGALAGAGLQLPDKFDLQGIISIVLQILGLTYAKFRARAVAIVGEPVVAEIERTAEVFKVIQTEGVPGLWRFIKEQLANLKSMVLDAIFNYIKDEVIIAGINWIIGLLTPASAFFKACKAIYDIVKFFVTRGRQILALVNAVIDSIAAIAKGSIGVAVGLIENALAKAIPVAIGFLASLLGLGDPSKPVREFIEKARAPVNKAIDWAINLAVKGVKAAGKFIGRLLGKKDKEKAPGDSVKKDLVAALFQQLTGEHTPEEARAIVASVGQQFRPLGVNRVVVSPVDEGSEFSIIVEMSPGEEVARLTPGIAISESPKVTLNVELTLAPTEPSEKGVIVGTVAESKKPEREDKREYEYLEAELETAETKTRSGKPTGGLVFPESGGKLQLMTWSTSSMDITKKSNMTHAERQFESWLVKMDGDSEGRKMLARVVAVEMHLRDLSPCAMCGDLFPSITKKLPNAKSKKLHWYKLYAGKGVKSPTTHETVNKIIELGWWVGAPGTEIPEAGGPLKVHIIYKLGEKG